MAGSQLDFGPITRNTHHHKESKTTMGFWLQYTNKIRQSNFLLPLASPTHHTCCLLELSLAIHNHTGGMAISPILATIWQSPLLHSGYCILSDIAIFWCSTTLASRHHARTENAYILMSTSIHMAYDGVYELGKHPLFT